MIDRTELALLISEQIGRTMEKIESYEASTAPVGPDNAIGRVSRMDAINNKSVIEAALRTAKVRLEQLRRMEKNIDSPHLGLCRGCGLEIPLKRVVLLPESPFCVRCA